ncbi:hypothetical protein GOV11_04330, partial [Candidatus Woesearchaeota archaeon]|nr:hypothetical protein [Candidatus Woesearchaeota archaeon]
KEVSVWTVLGAGGGGLLLGGAVGAMAGAAIGGLMTKYGPKMAQRILINTAKIKGAITVPKIMQMDLSESVKRDLVNSFKSSILVGSTSADPVHIPVAQRPRMRDDIRSANYMTPLERAQAITALNKNGEMVHMQKFISGGKKYVDKPMPTPTPKKTPVPSRSANDAAEVIRRRRSSEF